MKKVERLFLIIVICMLIIPLVSCNNRTKFQSSTYLMTDPFEHVNVSFYGKPDRGYVHIDLSECSDIIKNNFRFECKDDGHLSNGHITVVTAFKIKENNMNILRYQKNYIVTDVDFYPEKIEDYDKEELNKAIRNYADNYIENHIKDFHMSYYSKLDRTGWSKSGSFDYTYHYRDIKMFYSVHKKDLSKNSYFIIYELENDITCTEDMSDDFVAPMKKGDYDKGTAYVVVGTNSIKATSDKIFKKELTDIITKVFDTRKEAETFCTYGGEYETFIENFV